jgi:hypothetical protein
MDDSRSIHNSTVAAVLDVRRGVASSDSKAAGISASKQSKMTGQSLIPFKTVATPNEND